MKLLPSSQWKDSGTYKEPVDSDNVRVPRLEIDGATTYIDKDGSNNLTLTDAVTGTKTLAQLGAAGTGDLKADGTVPLTANWDVGAYKITANQLASDVATGTAPFVVSSTTVSTNLNADLLDGAEGSAYSLVADIDDVPVDAATTAPVSSNWAFDHVAAADPHPGYALESDALVVNEQEVVGRLTGGSLDGIALGIADNNVVQIDDAAAADNDYAKFTANGIEGVAYATVLSDIAAMPLAGGTMTGTITLAESGMIALDPASSADEKWSGITCTGIAGATLVVGNLVYLDATATEWLLADANDETTAGDVPLALCILAANDGQATNLLLIGTMRSAAFPASIALGAPVYVGVTAGDIQAAKPTATTDIVRRVGWAMTVEPNTIYFNPSNDYLELA